MLPGSPPARPRARAAALCLAALLALLPGRAQAQELADLMADMDKAFAGLIRSLLLVTAQKNDPAPALAEVAKEAAQIAGVAGKLPGSGAFPGDQAFLKLAREALEAARRAEAAAKEKRLAEAVAALVRLHAACTGCHSEFRF
ncbi:MAG: cytochrome c [Candidatus Tectomicrobia bacterium]|nr:cytochrome c [Candidatus Tectomicrobia bacterium]